MKKIIYILILTHCALITAQTKKTVVTINGEKVTLNINPLVDADNGLTKPLAPLTPADILQLGGKLTKTTTITTTSASILEIKGDKTGAIKITDGNQGVGQILTSDAAGVATWQKNTGTQKSLYQEIRANAPYTFLPNVEQAMPGISSYTAPMTGKYQVIFHSFFLQNWGMSGRNFYYYDFLIKNGSAAVGQERKYGYVEDFMTTHISTVISLNQFDIIDFRILTTATNLSLPTNSQLYARTSVEVMFLGI